MDWAVHCLSQSQSPEQAVAVIRSLWSKVGGTERGGGENGHDEEEREDEGQGKMQGERGGEQGRKSKTNSGVAEAAAMDASPAGGADGDEGRAPGKAQAGVANDKPAARMETVTEAGKGNARKEGVKDMIDRKEGCVEAGSAAAGTAARATTAAGERNGGDDSVMDVEESEEAGAVEEGQSNALDGVVEFFERGVEGLEVREEERKNLGTVKVILHKPSGGWNQACLLCLE